MPQTPNTAIDQILMKLIQASGAPVTTRTSLNFTGSGFVVTDNPSNDSTDVSVSASGGSSGQKTLTLATGLNHNVSTDGSLLQSLSLSGTTTLGGLAPSAFAAGQLLVLQIPATYRFFVMHQDPGSTSGNRINVPGLTVAGDAVEMFGGVLLQKDAAAGAIVATSLGSQYLEHVNPKRFGLKLDGATDDTAALNAMNTFIGATTYAGSKVLWPQGSICKLTSRVVIPPGSQWVSDSLAPSLAGTGSWAPTFVAAFPAGHSGTAATVSSVTAEPVAGAWWIMTITGCGGASAGDVGQCCTVSNAATASNNDTLVVAGYSSAAGGTLTLIQPIQGRGSVTEANNGSLHWVIKDSMFSTSGHATRMSGLTLNGNYTVAKLIDATYNPADGLVCSAHYYERISMLNSQKGFVVADVGVNAASQAFPSNCDLFTFDHCYTTNMNEDGVFIPNTTGQSKGHLFLGGSIAGSRYGLRVRSGSYYWYGGLAGGGNRSAFADYSDADAVIICGGQSENTARLYTNYDDDVAAGIGINAPQLNERQVKIEAFRFDPGMAGVLAADGQAVQYKWGGGLEIEACTIGSPGTSDNISVGLGSSAAIGNAVATIRDTFFGTAPTNKIVTSLSGSNSGLVELRNVRSCNNANPGLAQRVYPDGKQQFQSAVDPSTWQSPPEVAYGKAHPWGNYAAYFINGSNDNTVLPFTRGCLVTGPGVSGAYTWTGIAATAASYIGGTTTYAALDGEEHEFIIPIAQQLTIKHNATSTVGNRFFCLSGADLVVPSPGGGSIRVRVAFSKYLFSNAGGWYVLDT